MGFQAVVPASWGDELVAARVLERLRSASGPMVQCSCPRVAQRLAPNADAIAPLLLCTISPAAATAEYLRALYAPTRPAITFAGGCPGADHEAIDERMTSAQLLSRLRASGIEVALQPTEFETLPPDRRRFYSEPGGLPTRSSLRQVSPQLDYAELGDDEFTPALAQLLLADQPTLVDAAVALGCACSGADAGVNRPAARARIREHEPPRAPGPVVDHAIPVALDASLPAVVAPVATSATVAAPVLASAPSTQTLPQAAAVADPPRRRSPAGLPRPVFGAAPRARTDGGRALPRAYVARRRSTPTDTGVLDTAARQDVTVARRQWAWLAGGIAVGAVLMWLAGLVFLNS
jgi:hypothetical protein